MSAGNPGEMKDNPDPGIKVRRILIIILFFILIVTVVISNYYQSIGDNISSDERWEDVTDEQKRVRAESRDAHQKLSFMEYSFLFAFIIIFLEFAYYRSDRTHYDKTKLLIWTLYTFVMILFIVGSPDEWLSLLLIGGSALFFAFVVLIISLASISSNSKRVPYQYQYHPQYYHYYRGHQKNLELNEKLKSFSVQLTSAMFAFFMANLFGVILFMNENLRSLPGCSTISVIIALAMAGAIIGLYIKIRFEHYKQIFIFGVCFWYFINFIEPLLTYGIGA